MAAKRYNLEEARQLWRQEPNDDVIFNAATKDIEEYPPEIQGVIKEEAERRRRLNETAGEGHKESRLLEFTWDGVVGFLFFIGAAIMGASFPIQALMLAVGIVVGHFVKEVVKGGKKKNVSSDKEGE